MSKDIRFWIQHPDGHIFTIGQYTAPIAEETLTSLIHAGVEFSMESRPISNGTVARIFKPKDYEGFMRIFEVI